MLGLLKRLFGDTAPASGGKDTPAPEPMAVQQAPAATLCREAVLDAGQTLLGYQFNHLPATRGRAERRGRAVRHAYAEVLVRSLAAFGLDRRLGRRLALLELPDSFIDHASIDELASGQLILVLRSFADAPPAASLVERVAALRRRGVRIGLVGDPLAAHHEPLLAEADLLAFDGGAASPEALARRIRGLRAAAPASAVLIRGIAGPEEFALAGTLGASLFQGGFVTAREPWEKRSLGPDTARLADLLSRLRRDADTRELADALKRDGALSVRLLRYVNSAAVGLSEPVQTFEHALQLLGRARLERWLTLLMLSADGRSPRASAVLEGALVRGRMMELLGHDEPVATRDGLFMTGLLSLIDVILEMPMADALAAIDLPADIRATLLAGEGRGARLLALAGACERADRHELEQAAQASGVTVEEAGECHALALAWALDVAD